MDLLKLPAQPHPQPIDVHWLTKGGLFRVNHLCKVPGCLGPYHDDINCDVVHKDVCHILLGQPWQFDRRTMHDGYDNMYFSSI